MNGMQMMIANAIKSAAENLPPEIQENILNVGQTVASFKAQLDRIEAQNRLILQFMENAHNDRISGSSIEPGKSDSTGTGNSAGV